MTLNKFLLVLNTLKHLKFIQTKYQIWYRIKRKFKLNYSKPSSEIKTKKINWSNSIFNYQSYKNNSFTFINLFQKFDKIDWNFPTHGKLWTYNLTYFDYLNQEEISLKEGLNLIHDFIDNHKNLIDGLESYPISLRGINWIKFISINKINDDKINAILYEDYNRLYHNLEYHLLGNHLLENAFSLLFGSYYFSDDKFYKKSKCLLLNQLNEQILNDGSHFELSPMYHQIILYRLLDSIQLLKLNPLKQDDLKDFLEEKASKMLSWIGNVTFKNGQIPLVHDSANKIAPSTKMLVDYASKLNIKQEKIELGESNYRMIRQNNFECFANLGSLKANYIPGHTHADIFNFLLNINNLPVIIDTGISTYNSTSRRRIERSTLSHNTVSVLNKNQSDIWDSFKMGKRASVFSFIEKGNSLKASHNGFKNNIHTREFKFKNNDIIISDSLKTKAKAYFHFHKNINIELNNNSIVSDKFIIEFKGFLNIKVKKYNYSTEFNVLEESLKIIVEFDKNLNTLIKIKD